ncbi:hypothetical protein E2562_022431 [Oryza meyeriana var. granulata]|uniref:Uncharacterized protein n=1 Tax=Oryza meyeriana var. granulata TaxID=110450 RepID=A0A6G1BMK7_9ORYZ|nr:hypothetical protein E2562_022431 [Oryza meyeriana var. granulata]
MAQQSKPLLALLLCLMIAKGNYVCMGCMNDHVVVRQRAEDHSKVGGVHALSMFKVTVTNRCCFELRNVVVVAPGFRSAIPVDPKLFRRNPGGWENYLIGDGETIPANGSVTFFYAWHTMFLMDVAGMTVSNCL